MQTPALPGARFPAGRRLKLFIRSPFITRASYDLKPCVRRAAWAIPGAGAADWPEPILCRLLTDAIGSGSGRRHGEISPWLVASAYVS
jgi:hypothetical protein